MARRLDRGLDDPNGTHSHRRRETQIPRERGGAGGGALRDEPGRSQEVDGEVVLLQGPLLPRGRPHPYPTFGRSAGLSRTRTHALAAPPGPRLLRPRARAAPSPRPGTLPPARPREPAAAHLGPRAAAAAAATTAQSPGPAGGGTAETTPTRDHARGSRAPERPRPARGGSVSGKKNWGA